MNASVHGGRTSRFATPATAGIAHPMKADSLPDLISWVRIGTPARGSGPGMRIERQAEPGDGDGLARSVLRFSLGRGWNDGDLYMRGPNWHTVVVRVPAQNSITALARPPLPGRCLRAPGPADGRRRVGDHGGAAEILKARSRSGLGFQGYRPTWCQISLSNWTSPKPPRRQVWRDKFD